MENSTDIITGQYVRLREVPASIADRIVATAIDCAVLVAYAFLLFMGLNFLSTYYPHASNTIALLILLLIVLPCVLYFPVCEFFFNGQSIGKALRHTRVISADGARPPSVNCSCAVCFFSLTSASHSSASCLSCSPTAISASATWQTRHNGHPRGRL